MMLIFVLDLIAKIKLASSDCDLGTQDVKTFDWSKVRIVVLTRFLEQEAFKFAAFFLFFICYFINSYSIDYTRLYFRVIE